MATEFTQSCGASGPICCFFFLFSLMVWSLPACHHTGLSTRKMHQRIFQFHPSSLQNKWTAPEKREKFNLSVLKNRKALEESLV